MSRRPSEAEINQVRDYIEYCIMHYKNKKETMEIIANQANIEPVFTQTIWEEMELQNREFFEAYYIRTTLIDQINRFNGALLLQAELMQRHNGVQQQRHNGVQAGPNASLREVTQRYNGSQQHASGSQYVPQPMKHHNGLQQCPGATQQALRHQYDGLHSCCNASHRVYQHNGLQQCPSTTQQAPMHQGNELQQGQWVDQLNGWISSNKVNGLQQGQWVDASLVHHYDGLHSDCNASQRVDQFNGLQQCLSTTQQAPMGQYNDLQQVPVAIQHALVHQHGHHSHSNASQWADQHNGLQQCPSYTQQAPVHQHNELQQGAVAAQQEPMYQQNGLQQRYNATPHAQHSMQQNNELQHHHDELLHHFDGSQHTEPMHQPYLNNGSNVSTPRATESSSMVPQQDGSYSQGNLGEVKYVDGLKNEGATCGKPW